MEVGSEGFEPLPVLSENSSPPVFSPMHCYIASPTLPPYQFARDRPATTLPPPLPSTASNANGADAPAFLNIALCSLLLKHVLLVGEVDAVGVLELGHVGEIRKELHGKKEKLLIDLAITINDLIHRPQLIGKLGSLSSSAGHAE